MNPVHSWDVFDTLIGRRCGTPQRLWEEIAREAQWPEFPAARRVAEARLQRTGRNYTLDEIHRDLLSVHGRNCPCLEYETERQNAFPIARYADQVCEDDIAVSDMYLNADEIQGLLEHAGLPPMPVYVSCYGKTKGTIWPELLTRHRIVRHTGDNPHSDVQSPKSHGIATEFAETGFSPAEALYAKFSEPLAWWTRANRLSRDWPDPEITNLQIQYNAPLLLAACWDIRRVVREKKLARVAFLARDGCLIGRMWNHLFPDIPADYLWCSRECLRRAAPGYVAYLSENLTSDTLVVDLAASFRSFAAVAPKLPACPALYTVFRVNYQQVPDLPVESLLDQRHTVLNNTYLEMLNYARHWHVQDMRDGQPVFDEPDEYDLGVVSRYHRTFDQLLDHLPTEPIANPKEIADHAARQIHAAGPAMEKRFPDHMKFEKSRRLPAITIPCPAAPPPGNHPVIVGAICDYRKPQFIDWIRSLVVSDFRGQVHMLTYRCPPDTIRQLKQRQYVVHEGEIERHVVVDRFRDLATLARTLPARTWMISLDVNDLVMQHDPSSWLARLPDSTELVVGSECIRMCDQWWVNKNLLDTFPEHYDEAAPRLLYNAGSFAARASAMAELAADVWAMCCQRTYTKNNDQDAFNILLHRDKYRPRVKFAEQRDGWCANIAATVCEPFEKGAKFATEPLATLKNGICYVENAIVPCFLHHYTRDPKWKRDVLARIRSGQRIKT